MKRTLALAALTLLASSFAAAQDVKKNDASADAKAAQAQTKTDDRQSAQQGAAAVEYLSSGGPQTLPFSEAVRVGQMLYLSGQVGVDEKSNRLVAGGIKAETAKVMERIRGVLERHGSGLDRVVKCTVMLADMSEWGAMNEVYVTYFPKDRRPARSALGANGLALGARVEIECTAVVK
ncbi:MAG TPA: RidA family protein [Pyrinomonadaceae bacterium]|jgi:reactive intermediate/imine deaminase